jgi:serine phosphatase RsbU (regulator of sigma subunit)
VTGVSKAERVLEPRAVARSGPSSPSSDNPSTDNPSSDNPSTGNPSADNPSSDTPSTDTPRPDVARDTARRTPPRAWPYWAPAAVLIIGLAVTAALALVSHAQYNKDEKRLLNLRVKEVAAVLEQAQPNVQIPLASAAALADATGGNVAKFTRFISRYVGPPPSHQFVTVSLWRAGSRRAAPIVVVGATPRLTASGMNVRAFMSRAARTPKLSVIGLRAPELSGVGYAFRTPESTSHFIAYGESLVPGNRRSRLERSTAFSDLDYVVYLGNSEHIRDLLVTSLSTLPVRGQRAKLNIPFGGTGLTLVVTPRQPLAGTVAQRLPLIITIAGIILSLGAGALTLRLAQRRRAAEVMAGRLEHAVDENRRMFAEQRAIAHTLQQALLPDQLPQIRGAEAAGLFEPGQRGVEIGGDWYDVIPRDDDQVLLVVGDVSGRGLRAAATMASLRYAIHAYAAQNDSPETILAKLSKLLSLTVSGQLATVLCALIDVPAHQVTVASAGHLPPLLIGGGRSEYLESDVGLPVGVQEDASYVGRTVSVPPGATLLAFTDGLVERRGERLDDGLARLLDAATSDHAELRGLLTALVGELAGASSEDDAAIVGLRWSE